MNSTLITSTDRLLASGLLSLSVLNFTTQVNQPLNNNFLRKSSFTGLLGDFVLLFSSLLDISKAHTSNRSLNLVGLLASALALLSSLKLIWKSGHYFSLLVVTSPGNSPSNTSGLLLLVHQRAGLLGEITDGLKITNEQDSLLDHPCGCTYHRDRGKSCIQRMNR